jgi:hypothetical protein
MTEIVNHTNLSQFQYDKNALTGNEVASTETVRQLEKELDIQFTTEQFDVLKNLFMQGKNPTEALDDPAFGALSKTSTDWLDKLSGDDVQGDIYAFMSLFQKLAQTMRQTAQTQRTSELVAQVSELQNAAEQMEKAATMRLVAGCVQSGLQIAGGLAQIGFSSASLKSSVQGAKLEAQGSKMIAGSENQMKGPESMGAGQRLDMKNSGIDIQSSGKQLSAVGANQQSTGQAVGSIMTGAGQVAGSGFNYAADKEEQKKAEMDVRAKEHEVAQNHANEMMQQMMEVIRDIKDKLQSIQQTSIETNRGIARNI